jgi:hypothetical protein
MATGAGDDGAACSSSTNEPANQPVSFLLIYLFNIPNN